MQKSDFLRVFAEDLTAMYNTEEPAEGFEDGLWNLVHELSIGEFKQGCIDVIKENRRFPNIAAFKRVLFEPLQRADANRKRLVAAKELYASKCNACQGTGWLGTYDPSNPLCEISFLCYCDAPQDLGIDRSRGVVRWNQSAYPHLVPIIVGPLGNFGTWMKAKKEYQLKLMAEHARMNAKGNDRSTTGVPL